MKTEPVPTCTSPLFGTGEVYHCSELGCPIHGERNSILADAEKLSQRMTRDEALAELAKAMGFTEGEVPSQLITIERVLPPVKETVLFETEAGPVPVGGVLSSIEKIAENLQTGTCPMCGSPTQLGCCLKDGCGWVKSLYERGSP